MNSLLFILIFASDGILLIIVFSTSVILAEGFKPLRSLDIVVFHKLAVIQRNHRQDLIHFLFSVNSIHVLCAHSEFIGLVANNPNAACREKTHGFSNFTKDLMIDENSSLSYLLLALDFRRGCLIACFDRGGMIITKDIVFF